MKQHILSVHEDNKPFKCDICDFMSSLKSNLNRHVASVHEEKSHSNVRYVTTTVLEKLN